MEAPSQKNTADIYEAEYIKDLFNSMSVSYERMNYITSFGFSYRWRLQFLKKITIRQPGLQVLDLMTGMGETWIPVKDYLPGSKLTALDFCDGMIANAHKKNSKKFGNEVIVLKEDVLNNKLPDNSFDVVVCGFGLKTFNEEQLGRLAEQVKRILKPGGQFSFIEVSVPKNALLHFFYKSYLKHLIPVLGRLMLGNSHEYRMLWKYTSIFVNAEKAAKIFADAGLQARHEAYFYGCASGISGSKNSV
jgi:demethylmenaquinone methyltransferase/2-methoxy-6-polyprenyl-1,4-benzoquinol methylase